MEKILKQILGELGSLREGQQELIGRVGTVEKNQELLAANMMKLHGRMGNLESGQKKLEIKIEHDVVGQLQILSDSSAGKKAITS